jgi:hypothetical protein
MNPWIAAAGTLAALTGAAALVWRHRRRRDRMYARLASRHCAADVDVPIEIVADVTLPDAQPYAAVFAVDRLACVEEFVAPATLDRLRDEAQAGIPFMDHSYIPLHKKGNTLSYEQILRRAPHLLGFYHDRAVQSWISAVAGVTIQITPMQDQSSLSVLCYKEAADHINWHYDHNFYRGRHFTVLLSPVNRAAAGGMSHSRLERQLPDGTIRSIAMPENTLVIFEGARVRHRATQTAAGDLRVILSMTYCADSRISRLKELARRLKDVAFYGIRALWD